MTRTGLLVAVLASLVLWLLIYLLITSGYRAVHETSPPDQRFVAASAGRAFVADMEAMPTTTTTLPPTTTTTARARTAPTVRAVSRPAVVDGSVWDRLSACEANDNPAKGPTGWASNTGNGYFGGLQMDMTFWRSYGGPSFAARPDLASREQQIVVAERARDSGRGYHPWPTCARRLGLI